MDSVPILWQVECVACCTRREDITILGKCEGSGYFRGEVVFSCSEKTYRREEVGKNSKC